MVLMHRSLKYKSSMFHQPRVKLATAVLILCAAILFKLKSSLSTLTNNHKSNEAINFSNIDRTMILEYKLIKEDVLNNRHFKRYGVYECKTAATDIQDCTNSSTNRPITIKDWAELFSDPKNDHLLVAFTNFINQSTTDSKYEAYYFETKGTSMDNAPRKQFEFVLVQAERLHEFCQRVGPTPEVFQEYLNCIPQSSSTCAFDNLGRTARLISPKNLGDYSHIGKFFRSASKEEIVQLWHNVAKEYLISLRSNTSKSFWLSTSGTGVSWLHFRIDETPKYYTYLPFREEK